jgi:hypothetical protein
MPSETAQLAVASAQARRESSVSRLCSFESSRRYYRHASTYMGIVGHSGPEGRHLAPRLRPQRTDFVLLTSPTRPTKNHE